MYPKQDMLLARNCMHKELTKKVKCTCSDYFWTYDIFSMLPFADSWIIWSAFSILDMLYLCSQPGVILNP